MKQCIEVKDVEISFQEKKALDHLSFQVKEGEVFGFLGPSGAGKTTTIKLLSGQLKADEGDISVMGISPLVDAGSLYQNIGILTDTSGVYEKLTVEENLKIFADIYQIESSRIQEVLEELGLSEDKKKKAGKLSRGMRQRLLFARAVLHKPKLLFLDEPTANLDPATSEDVHKIIRELNGQGTTVFVTTHNMTEADELCDRVAFLHEGKIEEIGNPDELKVQYAKNEIEILYEDGEKKKISKNNTELLQELENCHKQILTIHSIEPNLKDIFLKLTGRELA